MTAITVRQLPEGVKQQLRMRAAANGRSMEAEARSILVAAVTEDHKVDLSWIDQLIESGGVEGVVIPEVSDTPAEVAEFDA